MGKFDGMDPKLVRDLLAEVKRATTQLRTMEGRVTQAMSTAGLATHATYRPAQVADTAEEMVRDVNTRLTLLEKKADRPKAAETGATLGGDAKERHGDERARYENPRADTPKADDAQPKDTPKTGEDHPKDTPRTGDGQPKHTPKAEDPQPKDTPKTGDTHPKDTPKADDAQPKDTPKTGGDVRTGDDGKPCHDTRTGDGTRATEDPRATGTPKTGDTPTGTTPIDNHPDAHKPQVVVVDGVKVLQVPIDPPTAAELDDLLRNIDHIRPADMPAMPHGAHNGTTGTGTEATNPWANDGSDVANATPPNSDASAADHARNVQPIDVPRNDPTDTPSTTGTTPCDGANQPTTPPTDGTRPTTPPTDGTVQPTPPPSDGTTTTPATPPTDGTTPPTDGRVTPATPPTHGTTQPTTPPTDGTATPTTPPTDGTATPTTPRTGDVIPPTAPAGDNTSATQVPQTPSTVGGDATATHVARPPTTGDGSITLVAQHTTEAGAALADGGDVVSVDARPMDLDTLRTVVEHARDIQPLDLPSVDVPAGEYGHGEWAPRDVGPDGPPGSVDPGTPERSA
ncbi:hypothetical protein ABT294_01830 [Nonomuraea sp. NPDC000554]|uniref:hypothetical protein n=1 Tax=Nonomuraea sp. NPDC000554 TaxID=3154259 RepID=UPI003332638E